MRWDRGRWELSRHSKKARLAQCAALAWLVFEDDGAVGRGGVWDILDDIAVADHTPAVAREALPKPPTLAPPQRWRQEGQHGSAGLRQQPATNQPQIDRT